METSPILRYFLVGQIRREYIITAEGKAFLDIVGGNALYAAGGLAVWDSNIGIVSRISNDFPHEFLTQISSKGFDIAGIIRINQTYPMNSFYAYRTPVIKSEETPVTVFNRVGIPFPKQLIKILPPDEQSSLSLIHDFEFIRPDTIPESYLDTSATHICPMDELTQQLLPIAFRQGNVTTITLDPSSELMTPYSIGKIKDLAHTITALITSEDKLRKLYSGLTTDIWEMAEDIGSSGYTIVVIKRGVLGQFLYNSGNRNRWLIPAYPTTVVDITGAGDSFCGGFLAGYRNTYDPLEAVLYGNISASFTIEGTGPFYAMASLSELAQTRLNVLRQAVRKV